MKRAALYVRVSTEEQAMHGDSLEAQRENLEQYAKEHGFAVVGRYEDCGYSARKPYKTRPEFMRLLSDIEADKVDIVLFIKLDRWFRSNRDYHKVQEILETHGVAWQATLEDYETVTPEGRFKVALMVALAENEADRTSARIKFVNASKVARGEVITGNVPLGYKIENKHLVIDPETAPMVRDLFRYYGEHGSKHGACVYLYQTYGRSMCDKNFDQMLRQTIYKGEYRGNTHYCEPLIDPELFDRLSVVPKARLNQTRRVYLFSGVLRCKECGYAMGGMPVREYSYYRCSRYNNYGDCVHRKLLPERTLEQFLLENVQTEIGAFLATCELEAAAKKREPHPRDARAELKRKMVKLKDLYLEDAIDKAEYIRNYRQLEEQLSALPEEAPPPPKVDVEKLKAIQAMDLRAEYAGMDREQKRTFWHSIIRRIEVDTDNNITLFF